MRTSLVWSLPNLDLRTCCGYQAPILGLFTPLPSGKGALVKWFLGHMPRLNYRLGKRQKEAATLTLSQHPLSLSPHLPHLRQQEAPDLFQWLCSDSLKLCCPSGTFGPSCLRESFVILFGSERRLLRPWSLAQLCESRVTQAAPPVLCSGLSLRPEMNTSVGQAGKRSTGLAWCNVTVIRY